MAIVRNIQNNDLYRYHGENKYTNLRTGVSGEIGEELAGRIFKINAEATYFFNEYPEVEKLFTALGMRFITDKTLNNG